MGWLLFAEGGRRGTARLSWLRQPPGVTSAKSVKQIVERLLFVRGLGLPTIPPTLHQNRVLQLARKCSKYQTQPLLKFKAERRHALLVAHLFELSQDLTDQALDQFDKLLGELMRKGERRQEKHFQVNTRKLNSHLTILTRAAEAFCKPGQKETTRSRQSSTRCQNTSCKPPSMQRNTCCAQKIWTRWT
jgi:hypothetical protein